MSWIDEDRVLAMHAGEKGRSYFHAMIPPVCLTSLHTFDRLEDMSSFDSGSEDAYIYGRVSNPTVEILEDKLCALEKGQKALCFASGMAAASALVFSICKQGSHIICVDSVYGPLRILAEEICQKDLGMSVTFVRGDRVEEFEEAINPNTRLILLESPSSLVFRLQDLRAVADLAKRHGVKTYIDNSYCTPLYQKPLTMGIDFVMHTTTKYIGGHSDAMGGVLIGSDGEFMSQTVAKRRELLGSVMGPFEAWLTIRGLRTLEVRLKSHEQAAGMVAAFLQEDQRVGLVRYPGLASHPQHRLMKRQQTGNCGLLSFDLNCHPEQIHGFVNALELFRIGVSWGGFESLVCSPYYHATRETAEKNGVTQTTVRIHCGLEGGANLIQDLRGALDVLDARPGTK